MSTPIFLLLSFLCLGTLEAFEPMHGASVDGSDVHVRSYIDKLRTAVQSQQWDQAGVLINDGFMFTGCIQNINKNRLLKMFKLIPAGAELSFDVHSSHFVTQQKIEFLVTLSGMGMSLNANFVIEASSGQWILISGTEPNCAKIRSFVLDSADSIAKSFLAHFQIDIASGDASKIAKRFSENFLFHGCHGDYNKQKVLGLLASIPAGSKVSMTFKSAEFVNGQDVQYTVVASGFGRPAFEAQFVLHKESGDYVLIGGKVPSCPARRFFVLDSADSIAKSFLAHFQIDIASGDATKIAKRFSDNFLFHGCHGDYNKQKVLGLLASIPAGSKVSMTFKSAEFVNGQDVQYTVIASGFGRPAFEAQFVLHMESGDYVLIGGKVPSCPASRFFLADSAETIAKSFLASFQSAIASGDVSKVSDKISENFLFQGCHDKYTKQKLIALLSSAPKSGKVSLTFESAQFVNGGDVQYTVTADGLGRPAFEAQFILRQENGDYVLIGGKVPTCPKRHFYYRFY